MSNSYDVNPQKMGYILGLKKYQEKAFQKRLEQYNTNPKKCLHCDKIIYYKNRKNKYCDYKCARKQMSIEQKKKQSIIPKVLKTKKRYHSSSNRSIAKTLQCIVCKKEFQHWKYSRKTCCSKQCSYEMFRNGGRNSSTKQKTYRRSKNEKMFAKLCQDKFGSVLENIQMFRGWDADIIIPDLKIAVLWNGVWHYKQITKKHSVKQVQTRDNIKIENIKSCGYIPYIVKDLGKHNPKFVYNQFELFVEYISKIKKF